MVWLAVVSAPVALAENVHHYIFVGMDRERLAEPGFLDHKGVEGVQVKYTWRQLEQGKDNYVFDDVRPIWSSEVKGKSCSSRFRMRRSGSNSCPSPSTCVKTLRITAASHTSQLPRRQTRRSQALWLGRPAMGPAVRERFHNSSTALGKEFDGQIEGINLPESAIDIPYAGPLMPSGYTREGYRDALLETMAALKKAFPKSTAMLYANFMSEADPSGKPVYLRSLYEKAAELKLGMGGPDLLPHRKWQLFNSYPLIREFSTESPWASPFRTTTWPTSIRRQANQ